VSDLFDFTTNVPRFAVMGNPVTHSKSPLIHSQFGEQLGIALEYTAIQVDVGGFKQAVDAFAASGGRGLNITVPFKGEAWEYAERRSAHAELAGAVNTLAFGKEVTGDNTDGSGIVRDIQENLGVTIAGRRVLVVGAGGATRGVLQPICEQHPATCVVANRTPDRAVSVASDLNPSLDMEIEASGLEGVDGHEFDIVINATAASLAGELPAVSPSVVASATLAYDMMYAKEQTPFMRWADEHGASRCSDGLGMLVEQAADAFAIWHGQRPDTTPVLQRLRASQ